MKEIISRVNQTLGYYEKDFISVKRTPISDKERCESFEQYLESRFNYECSRHEELSDIIIMHDGFVFKCKYINEFDSQRNRFKQACMTINTKLPPEIQKELEGKIGGTDIKFNSVKRKIKYSIEQ